MSSSNQPNHPYALQSSEELEAWAKEDTRVTLLLAKIAAAGVIVIILLLVIMLWVLSSYGANDTAGLITLIG